MYCPQCGQQQVSGAVRYCSRCGFLLEGVIAVLGSGGAVPATYLQPGSRKLSPRNKGVRQGAMLMLSTVLLVPLMAIISVFILGRPEIFVSLTAMFCFIGGLLRILYALLMEDSAPAASQEIAGYAPPQFERYASSASLPPASANPTSRWQPRPNTAEIYQPPSITENTTRLLDKEDPKNR